MAARDPALRPPLVSARDRFVAEARERFDTPAAAVVAALDGLILDALVRGDQNPDRLRTAVGQIIGGVIQAPQSSATSANAGG